MSTRITINTGGDALLARNAQQTQANRFSQLERENSRKVEAQGQQKREERLAAEGRNPDGTLQVGTYPRAERRPPDPAANRNGISFVLVPTDKVGYDFTVLNKAAPQAGFKDYDYFSAEEGFGYYLLPLNIGLGMGPSGSNALYDAISYPGIFYETWGIMTPCPYPVTLYGLQRNLYRLNPPEFSGDIPYSGDGPPTPERLKNKRFKSYTVEGYIKFPSTYWAEGALGFKVQSFTFDFHGIRFGLSTSVDSDGRVGYLDFFAGGVDLSTITVGEDSSGSWRVQGADGLYADGTGAGVDGVITLPTITIDAWHHFAIQKSDSMLSFYLGGTRLFSASLYSNYYLWKYVFALDLTPNRYSLVIGELPPLVGVRLSGAQCHGLRYTNRALYRSDTFTPPASITNPA